MDQGDNEPRYEMIGKRIAQLKQEKKLNDDSTVDEIIMDILIRNIPMQTARSRAESTFNFLNHLVRSKRFS